MNHLNTTVHLKIVYIIIWHDSCENDRERREGGREVRSNVYKTKSQNRGNECWNSPNTLTDLENSDAFDMAYTPPRLLYSSLRRTRHHPSIPSTILHHPSTPSAIVSSTLFYWPSPTHQLHTIDTHKPTALQWSVSSASVQDLTSYSRSVLSSLFRPSTS